MIHISATLGRGPTVEGEVNLRTYWSDIYLRFRAPEEDNLVFYLMLQRPDVGPLLTQLRDQADALLKQLEQHEAEQPEEVAS